MTQPSTAELRPIPEIMELDLGDLRAALALGWRDAKAAPLFGLFFSGVYVFAGLLLTFSMAVEGQLWWSIVAGAGFPMLGPFIACGFYEVSRRIEQNEPLDWVGVLGAVFRQKDRQMPTMAAIVVVFFLFWNFLAHMIFALFLGNATMTEVSSSLAIFATPEGAMMVAFGTFVGAVFSFVLYALSVASLPLLLDRDIDFITAMIASWTLVMGNFKVMMIWAILIATSLFAAMIPAFLGLFVVLPLFGHASWHLYRRAME